MRFKFLLLISALYAIGGISGPHHQQGRKKLPFMLPGGALREAITRPLGGIKSSTTVTLYCIDEFFDSCHFSSERNRNAVQKIIKDPTLLSEEFRKNLIGSVLFFRDDTFAELVFKHREIFFESLHDQDTRDDIEQFMGNYYRFIDLMMELTNYDGAQDINRDIHRCCMATHSHLSTRMNLSTRIGYYDKIFPIIALKYYSYLREKVYNNNDEYVLTKKEFELMLETISLLFVDANNVLDSWEIIASNNADNADDIRSEYLKFYFAMADFCLKIVDSSTIYPSIAKKIFQDDTKREYIFKNNKNNRREKLTFFYPSKSDKMFFFPTYNYKLDIIFSVEDNDKQLTTTVMLIDGEFSYSSESMAEASLPLTPSLEEHVPQSSTQDSNALKMPEEIILSAPGPSLNYETWKKSQEKPNKNKKSTSPKQQEQSTKQELYLQRTQKINKIYDEISYHLYSRVLSEREYHELTQRLVEYYRRHTKLSQVASKGSHHTCHFTDGIILPLNAHHGIQTEKIYKRYVKELVELVADDLMRSR